VDTRLDEQPHGGTYAPWPVNATGEPVVGVRRARGEPLQGTPRATGDAQRAVHDDGTTAVSGVPGPRLVGAALAAARSGLHVFPVRPYGKTPAVRDWEHAATIDPSVITEWWAARPYNIGIATGPSRLLVVDLDTARGATPPPRWVGACGGEDVLRVLAAEAGQPYPADTLTVTTPSGGRHLYFRMPAGAALRNTAGRLGWKIDTRGHGGFVVAPGSVRRDGRYRVTRSCGIAPLPAWLTDALTAAPPHSELGERPTRRPRTRRRHLQAILDSERDAVTGAQPGTRHTTLLAAACTLGRLVAGGELDAHDARSALFDAAARHVGVDGMTQREIVATINDGIQYGAQRPRRLAD
jgi:hypothetical protein